MPEPYLSAWRGVLRAQANVVGRIEEALATAGLPPLSWYDVLWALRSAPGRRVRMSELASELTLSRGGLTKLVDRLEAAGLLRREPAERDGRGSYAVLTDAGIVMLRRMWPVYSHVLEQAFVDTLSPDEAALLASALGAVAAAVGPRSWAGSSPDAWRAGPRTRRDSGRGQR